MKVSRHVLFQTKRLCICGVFFLATILGLAGSEIASAIVICFCCSPKSKCLTIKPPKTSTAATFCTLKGTCTGVIGAVGCDPTCTCVNSTKKTKCKCS